MKKFFTVLSMAVVVTMTIFSVHKGVVMAAGDLCGNTGGNGQIVSIGSNTFNLKLNDGGEKGSGNLIVNLTDHTTIETPNGFVSLSDLKTGDRVTLVGDNHRDGTFTADAVVVCNGVEDAGAQKNGTGHAAPITVRNNDPNYEKVNGAINLATVVIVGFIWIGTSLFLKLKKRKGFVYLLFFTVFYIYLYKVLDYTLLQFQSLLLLQHFLPNLMLNGVEAGRAVNLLPLITLTSEDIKTSLLNILMMMPFGFGLPFITNFKLKRAVISGLVLSIVIELLQLITGFIANTTFRVADVNDLIFNTLGVAVGYTLFTQFILVFRLVFRSLNMSNPILRYIADRAQ